MDDIDVYSIGMERSYADEILEKILLGNLAKELVEKRERKKSFFESPEFNQLLGIIRAQAHIDDEGLLYNTHPVVGLSAENFNRVCDSVFYVLEDKVTDLKGDMPCHAFIDYSGVRFNLAIGQGACYWTERLK
ncbi:hypothetical protein KA107_03125 [Candidatus Pacearchaeota archaeon]|nr:hypothetical protein [Candidatus Pacearchaeota archaeon]